MMGHSPQKVHTSSHHGARRENMMDPEDKIAITKRDLRITAFEFEVSCTELVLADQTSGQPLATELLKDGLKAADCRTGSLS